METLAETSYAARYFEKKARDTRVSQYQGRAGKSHIFQAEGFQFSEMDVQPRPTDGSMPDSIGHVYWTPLQNRIDGAGGEIKDNYFQWIFFRSFLWFMLIVTVTIIYGLIVHFIPVSGRYENAPLEILKSRYAWGGITKDEYWRIKK
jgi:uncharacterized membrane protein